MVQGADNPRGAPAAARPSVRLAIEERALFTPDAPALIDADGHMISWHELNARANRIADRLCELGAGPHSPVGLRGRSGAAALIGWLAAVKADAPVVPLGDVPSADEDRALAETGAKILLCAGGPEGSSRVTSVPVTLDGPMPTTPNLSSRGRPEHPALIVPTQGGSVRITQRDLVELVGWKARAFDAGGTPRVCILLSPTTASGLREIAATLAVGSTVCLPPIQLRDDAHLLDLLCAADIARLYLAGEKLEALAGEAARRDVLLTGLRDLVVIGGTLKLTPGIMRFLARHALCRVHMMHHAQAGTAIGACTLELPFASWAGYGTERSPHAPAETHQAGDFVARITPPVAR